MMAAKAPGSVYTWTSKEPGVVEVRFVNERMEDSHGLDTRSSLGQVAFLCV